MPPSQSLARAQAIRTRPRSLAPLATKTKTGEIFGANLRKIRVGPRVTQPQLVDRCVLNVPFISNNMERSVMLPGLAMLLSLAEALECDVTAVVEMFDADRVARKRRVGRRG